MNQAELFKECIFCTTSIPAKARICSHCGKGQYLITKWFFWLEFLPILLAIPLFLYSSIQFFEAGKERSAAKEALKKANEAVGQIKIVQAEINSTIEALKTVKKEAAILKREIPLSTLRSEKNLAENTLNNLNQRLENLQNTYIYDKNAIMRKLSADNSYSNRQERIRIKTDYYSSSGALRTQIKELKVKIQRLDKQLEKGRTTE